jgi:hypothetical protein
MSETGHGSMGLRQQPFTKLLKSRTVRFDVAQLLALANLMKGEVDTVKDGADPEENLWVPAGYTYFGQFVDHDLTFDSTSSLNVADVPDSADEQSRIPSNLRTPRLDLDCVYGDGPDAQPFMYADDGATLLYGGTGQPTHQANPDGMITSETASWDLLRAPNGRAIIGDKRNDENSIVCQIQLGFVKYHNAVVRRLNGEDAKTWNTPYKLFASAQNEVRWTYQRLVIEDFLPRIVNCDVFADLRGKTVEARKDSYALYIKDLRANLPGEFVAAAYRFAHSGVRTGYRLNRHTKLSIFPASNDTNQASDSLLGFDPLPKHHVIDKWSRFFPLTGPGGDIGMMGRVAADDTPHPAPRMQFAYKIDPTLVDPLGVLPPGVAGGATDDVKNKFKEQKLSLPNPDRPSLALLNLMRGNSYDLPTGQDVFAALAVKGLRPTPMTPDLLVVRTAIGNKTPSGGDKPVPHFQWTPIDKALLDATPLWFYILAEAQAPLVGAIVPDGEGKFPETVLLNGTGARTQLGWVGGRIVAEVFYGILDSDKESIFNAEKATSHITRMHGGKTIDRVRELLEFG